MAVEVIRLSIRRLDKTQVQPELGAGTCGLAAAQPRHGTMRCQVPDGCRHACAERAGIWTRTPSWNNNQARHPTYQSKREKLHKHLDLDDDQHFERVAARPVT